MDALDDLELFHFICLSFNLFLRALAVFLVEQGISFHVSKNHKYVTFKPKYKILKVVCKDGLNCKAALSSK